MLSAGEEDLARRAQMLADETGGQVMTASGRVGGGALPLLELPGPVVAIDAEPARPGGADALAAALRHHDPPVMARIRQDRLLLDPRTLSDDEAREVARAVRAVRAVLA
jgi:L-seryl-tRNA(Ser) seleniumtransferase